MSIPIVSRNEAAVFINPPLHLPDLHLDNPAFGFYPALCAFGDLARDTDALFFVDAFREGGISKKNGRIRLGLGHEEIIEKALAHHPRWAIIHYSSFLRSEGVYNASLHDLVRGLADKGVDSVFLDIYDTASLYLDFNQARVRESYPELKGCFKKYQLVCAGRPGRFPAERSIEYRGWLRNALAFGLIKDHGQSSSVFPYQSSFGCPHHCLFCKGRREKWRPVPVAEVLAELSVIRSNGFDGVHLLDAYPNLDLERFKHILRGCLELDLKLHFANGVGIKPLDEEAARLISMVEHRLFVSPESLCDATLSILRKPFQRSEILDSIALLNRCGVWPHAHFILGTPGEAPAQAVDSLEETARLVSTGDIWPHFQVFNSPRQLYVDRPHMENIHRRLDPDALDDCFLKSLYGNFTRRIAGEPQDKLILNLSYRCNNRCVFCAVGDRERIDGDFYIQMKAVLDAYQRGVRLLDLDGGEPLLYPRLFDILELAMPYSVVTLTTNGRMLAYNEYARKLAAIGNLRLLVSLHGPAAGIHDRLTQSPGSFRQTVSGIRNAVAHFPEVGVNTTVTSLNYRYLGEIAESIARLGGSTFNLQWYAPFGEVDSSLEPPPEAIECVERVVSEYGGRLKISLINFLYCQAPQLRTHMTQDYGKAYRHMQFADGTTVNLSRYLSGKRVYRDTCADCAERLICKGGWDYGPRTEAGWVTVGDRGQKPVPEMKRVRLLDLVPGYACNVRCSFCAAPSGMRKLNLGSGELIDRLDAVLAEYLPQAARIGGGEPTVRKDLFRLVRYLKQSGVHDLAIQTNGLMLSEPDYLDSLVDAGVNRIQLSLPGHDEISMQALTGMSGMFEKVCTAVGNVVQKRLVLEMDILVSKINEAHMEKMVDFLSGMGADRFNFWYISMEGEALNRIGELVPTMTSASRHLNRLFDRRPDGAFKSYYIPYCFFPDHLDKIWHPMDEDALVVTPQRSFLLEKGSLELGAKTGKCADCRFHSACIGVRANYLGRFGDGEIRPLVASGRKY